MMLAPQVAPADVTPAPALTSSVLGCDIRQVLLSEIHVGDNYRTTMDAEGLKELAESIVNSGLLQPATVRPLDEPIAGKYLALVAGGRRFAAHELAGLPSMLCNIRPMSEQVAQELRLIENLQREQPHAADECAAVALLNANGATDAEIAARLGKSGNTRWVAQRRAVSELPKEWLKDLRKDKITLSAAEELARWPQAVQLRMLANRNAYSVVTEQSVKSWLNREARLLSAAPWSQNDETLFPKAGACQTCPKRTSCASLFDAPDKGKDSCLDSVCWAEKLKRRTEQVLAENSTADLPVLKLSSMYYQQPTGSLTPQHYKVSKSKKGTRVAVYIDGPQQGHVVRVEVTGSPKPEQNQAERNKESRRKRLLTEASKRVVASRSEQLLAQQDEAGANARKAMLASIVAEQLLRNRTALEDIVVRKLVSEWKWEPITETVRKAMRGTEYKDYVRKQVALVAPTEAELQRLLLVAVTYYNITAEYFDHQKEVASVLGAESLTQGLDEAAQQLLEKEYDPTTLRARK